MNARTVIGIVALSVSLAGCSEGRKLWPWGAEAGVPVTRPTSEDVNRPEPASPPRAAETVVAVPRETAPPPAETVAVRPASPGALDRPINLTDLLYARKAAPGATTRPAATRPTTTQPAGKGPPRPDVPVATANVEPIGRTILPVGGKARPIGPERVVAASALQVNNRFITADDILRRLRPQLNKVPQTITPQGFGQRVLPWIAQEIREQINQALVLEEASKRLTDQQKKVIDAEVAQARNAMLAEAGGSITKLRQTLAKQGTTLEQVLTEHREGTAFRFYLRSRFLPVIVITRKMLWDYYRTRSEEFTTEKKVQMQIIAAPFNRFLPEKVARPSAMERQAARAKAKETIDQAVAALAKGEDFTQVAQRLSRGIKAKDGGVWPLMAADTFRETQVEQTAFRLKVGEMAGPIETKQGFYVVKVRRLQAGRVVPFEEAQETITQTLRNRMYLDLTEKYFRDLYGKALITRSEEFHQLVLKRAAEEHFRK